jgi:hypothetical protein
MGAPRNDDPPLAEPAAQQSGNEVGGMRASTDRGFGDATQRTMEHADGSALGRASTGDGSGGATDPRPDLGGKNEPGSADTASSHPERATSDDRATPQAGAVHATRRGNVDAAGDDRDDDSDPWRHERVAPVDERNPLKSLGRAVADTLADGAEDASEQPKR